MRSFIRFLWGCTKDLFKPADPWEHWLNECRQKNRQKYDPSARARRMMSNLRSDGTNAGNEHWGK